MPIGQIILNDYEDQIAVRLDNYGVGPLLIEKLLVSDGVQTHSTLFECMPKINQAWSNYVENIDGRTIQVAGKITLLKLNPIDTSTKTKVRLALSKLTITLKYKDVYGTKYTTTRDLTSFGKNLH